MGVVMAPVADQRESSACHPGVDGILPQLQAKIGNYIMALVIIETVALFVMVFTMTAPPNDKAKNLYDLPLKGDNHEATRKNIACN